MRRRTGKAKMHLQAKRGGWLCKSRPRLPNQWTMKGDSTVPMSWRMTTSAISSNSVASRLIITKRTSAVSFGKQGESSGRPHHQRRADREKKITIKSELFSASHFALRHRLTEGNRRRRAALLLRVREARGAPCVPRLSLAPLPLDIARLLSAVATVGLGGMVRDDEGGQSGALCFPRASPVL